HPPSLSRRPLPSSFSSLPSSPSSFPPPLFSPFPLPFSLRPASVTAARFHWRAAGGEDQVAPPLFSSPWHRRRQPTMTTVPGEATSEGKPKAKNGAKNKETLKK
uniref:Uncharacterized protein n=1 Tax=Solanum lycopersicum TaxID=4081 RepID=A0A3Q7HS73_SOLLC